MGEAPTSPILSWWTNSLSERKNKLKKFTCSIDKSIQIVYYITIKRNQSESEL